MIRLELYFADCLIVIAIGWHYEALDEGSDSRLGELAIPVLVKSCQDFFNRRWTVWFASERPLDCGAPPCRDPHRLDLNAALGDSASLMAGVRGVLVVL